ncbi:hypothetical protein C8Q75DRAFT_76228 [Abortiporus biennis]|nr:hypothetical protein C8Q75DRAFT_76228 [Abortiporus biennis]
MEFSEDKLNVLFPKPLPPPKNFGLIPNRTPGTTSESAQGLVDCLKHNYKRQHIFFNDRHFHNHAAHHILAIWALGANKKLVEVAYQTHVVYQKPAFPSPEVIDEKNWKDHLGDDKYYQAYLTFFSNKLLSGDTGNAVEDASTVFEDYIFSKDANLVPGATSKEPPYLLARYLGGFLHPLIHSGYGAEFGLLGTWAEGLAEACVQDPMGQTLFPPSLFESVPAPASVSDVIGKVAKMALFVDDSSKKASSPHALALLARVAQDPDFKPSTIGIPTADNAGESTVDRIIRVCGPKLEKILEEWVVSPDHHDLEKKLEEVLWMNVLVYAVGGYGGRNQSKDENKKFNGDFFLMHLVTSSLFMPSLMAHLTHTTAVLFLRSYFILSLVLYVARGRPALPIAEFYKNVTDTPLPPIAQPKPSEKTFQEFNNADYDPNEGREAWKAVQDMTTPNPWLPIIQTTLVQPNEHLCKLQRALAHFATVLGETAPGRFADLAGPGGLDGADLLDGTLFIRAAGLTADRLGWMREGQAERGWDFGGFFEE